MPFPSGPLEDPETGGVRDPQEALPSQVCSDALRTQHCYYAARLSPVASLGPESKFPKGAEYLQCLA